MNGIFIFILNSNFDHNIVNRLFSLDDRNAQSRLYLYIKSITLYMENPLGIGLGSFDIYNDFWRYPHNIFLEILVELGTIGFVIFLILICHSIKNYLNVRENYLTKNLFFINQYSLVILIFSLINGQFSGDIGSNEYIWYGMVLLKLVRWLNQQKYLEKSIVSRKKTIYGLNSI